MGSDESPACAKCDTDLTDPRNNGFQTDDGEWYCSHRCEHLDTVDQGDAVRVMDSDEPILDEPPENPALQASVSMRISEGAMTASWSDDDAEIRTRVDDIGFNYGDDKPGRVRFNVGASMDPQFGSGTGIEIWIDRPYFEFLMAAAAEEWDEVEIDFETGDGE